MARVAQTATLSRAKEVDSMIERVVRKTDLKSFSEVEENLAYWLSKTPEERISAVEHLRKRYYGDSARLQRVARAIERPRS